eukprot:GHVU01173597.1.p1 GENE.GHVU01173597.1~~GHVU01173597.1.p1  ORF type:complete len:141 (+),score=22.23 GHVU01173597.1:345-767(+)
MFSIVPPLLMAVASFLVSAVYPTVCSLRTILEPQDEKQNLGEAVQWLSYWVVVSFLSGLEQYVFFFIPKIIPCYPELRLAFILWMVLPKFRGAGWLWQTVLKEPAKFVQELYDEKVKPVLHKRLGFLLAPAIPEDGGRVR